MTEQRINERRNWKAEVFPYDHYIPDTSEECQYCLTDLQAEILRGIIEPLAWDTRWYSDTQAIDKDTIQAFRDDLIRRLMMGCCGEQAPIQFIWLSDGTLVTVDPDTGEQAPAPEFDPRNTSPIFPPVPGEDGDDKKCIAATGMAALIKEQVGDQLTDDMGRYTLGQLITNWVNTMINTANPFTALLTVISNQIFALVIATLRPALTDTVYGQLKCILYCDMASDASFDEAAWARVRSDITDQIGGIAGIFLEHLIFLLGKVGLTNLARAGGASAGDCSGCDCPVECTPELWTLFDDWIAIGQTVTYGSDYVEVTAVQPGGGGPYYIILKTDNIADCCQLQTHEIVENHGDFENMGYTLCNNTVNEYVPGALGDPSITGVCINHLYCTMAGPSKVRFVFAAC